MGANIFKKRVNYKPFEYPEVNVFIDAMNKSFWVHNEIEFTADIQDFNVECSEKEKEVIKRSLLAISQVEVGVKAFWGDLHNSFPKPEFNNLGATFAESEVRHSEAYARLLEVMGLNNEFKNLLTVPVFKKKIELIDKYMKSSVAEKMLFFTIVIENSSLFSQFANILSFTRFKGLLKNTSNIIAWTSIDEQTHANAGIYILNKLREEGYITEEMNGNIYSAIKEFIEYEKELLDWIYEKGELDFFTKKDLISFMKRRVDDAMVKIGLKPIYEITEEEYKPMRWFDEEVFANSLDDFFAKRPTEYTKHDKPITAKDLF